MLENTAKKKMSQAFSGKEVVFPSARSFSSKRVATVLAASILIPRPDWLIASGGRRHSRRGTHVRRQRPNHLLRGPSRQRPTPRTPRWQQASKSFFFFNYSLAESLVKPSSAASVCAQKPDCTYITEFHKIPASIAVPSQEAAKPDEPNCNNRPRP